MTISWHVGLLDWQTDTLSLAGIGIESALAAGYFACATRSRHSARPWPLARTFAFLAGLLVLALSLQSGFARYDDIFWVHVVQHQALMALAPALLMLGAPVILLLRVLPTERARQLVGVLHKRWLSWMSGPSAAIHLPLHYYGIMYLYLLTPAYALGERNELFHDLVHVYFLGCGLMFWLPVLGRYPSHWHPSQRVKLRMVAIGLPLNLALAAIVAARAPITAATGTPATLAGAWALADGGVVLTLLGLLFVRLAQPARRPAATARIVPGPAAMAVDRRA